MLYIGIYVRIEAQPMVAGCPAEHSNRYFPGVRPFRNVSHKPNSTHAPTNQPSKPNTSTMIMMMVMLLRWTMLQFMWQDLLESDRTPNTEVQSGALLVSIRLQNARGVHMWNSTRTTNYGKRILACWRTLSVHICVACWVGNLSMQTQSLCCKHWRNVVNCGFHWDLR